MQRVAVHADTITDNQSDDTEMHSEEDFERLSIYHVPDKTCPPYTFDRIRKTLPSNLALLPSSAQPNVSGSPICSRAIRLHSSICLTK